MISIKRHLSRVVAALCVSVLVLSFVSHAMAATPSNTQNLSAWAGKTWAMEDKGSWWAIKLDISSDGKSYNAEIVMFNADTIRCTGAIGQKGDIETSFCSMPSDVLMREVYGSIYKLHISSTGAAGGATFYNEELETAFVSGRSPSVPLAPAPQSVSSAAADSAMWESIKYSSQVSDFQRYLETYPNGLFIKFAENQIRDLIENTNTPAAQKDVFAGINFGSYHALVIGIDNYKHITKLETAIRDAKAVAETLKSDYGFKVTLLIDPARGDILNAFDDYLETLGEKDNLLIYYAGHGWLDDVTERGYWLPVGAREGRRSQWLSNADITDTLKSLQAKHVMLVADSCYSGTLTRAAAVGLRDKGYLKRMSQKRARVAMVSGGLEPVADDSGSGHSPFAKAFIDALKHNSGVVDGTRLFSQIRRPVILNAQQTPEYSDVRNSGHDGGDFLFVRKQ